MSLINQVLRDLDRQANEGADREAAEVTPFPVPPPVPKHPASRPLWLTVAAFVLGAVVAGGLLWENLGDGGAPDEFAPDSMVGEAPPAIAESTPSAIAPTPAPRDNGPGVAESPVAAVPAASHADAPAPVAPEQGKQVAVTDGGKYIPLIVTPDTPRTVAPIEKTSGKASRKAKVRKVRERHNREAVVKHRPVTPKEGDFDRAQRFIEAGRLSEAEAALNKTLKMAPGNVRARTLLAGLMLRGGRKDEAGRLLDEGLRLTPADPDLAVLKGRLLMESRDDKAALALLERTLPEGRRGMQHLAMLGALYQRQGLHHRAVGAFERLLALDPRNASAWAGTGISLEALQVPEKARKAFRRALSLPGLSPIVRRYVQGRLDTLETH